MNNLVAVIVLLAVALCCTDAVLFKAKHHLYKAESECEKFAQSGKYETKCGLSASQCRSCCHFDLERLNNRYNEKRYHIKDVMYAARSGECVCEFCKKYVEDFNNAAYF